MSYDRTGRFADEDNVQELRPSVSEESTESAPKEKVVKIDGFRQVLEMLQAADPEFRASLLSRISARDPALGSKLRQTLGL